MSERRCQNFDSGVLENKRYSHASTVVHIRLRNCGNGLEN